MTVRDLAIALALLIGASSAPGQSVFPIRPGQPQSGTLSESDRRSPEGAREDRFTFRGEASQQVAISMTSRDFDAVLRLIGPDGRQEVNDDAAAGSPDAGIETTLQASGTYIIVATTFAPEGLGAYSLTLDIPTAAQLATAPPTPQPASEAVLPATRIGVEESVQGRLEEGDHTSPTGQLEDRYEFEGAAGQRLAINVEGQDLDPSVRLATPGGKQTADDDSGVGANALLRQTLAESGMHIVTVTSFQPGQTGAYTLRIEEDTSAATGAGNEITLNQPVYGNLQQSDEQIPSGEHIDRYTFNGRAGQPVSILLQSGEFDAYLALIGPSGFQIEDDDRGGGTDARIEMTLAEDGPHHLIVTGWEQEDGGAYTLTVTPGQPGAQRAVDFPPPIDGAQPLAIDQQITGPLGPGDEQRRESVFMDRYAVQASAGQTLEVMMQSDALDPYLVIASPDGEEHHSDDTLDSLNARLLIPVTQAGAYQVIASTPWEGQGAYSLSVRLADLPPNSPGGPMQTGQTIHGLLGPGDPKMRRGEHCDEFTLPVTRGQRLSIRMHSEDFDSYLIYVDPSGAQQENDDFGDLRTSGLDVTVGTDGTARLGATSLMEDEVGAYTLSVAESGASASTPAAIAAPANATRIARNQSLVGSLGPGDQMVDGAFAEAYTFLGRAGEAITVTMTSPQFTTRVSVIDPSRRLAENAEGSGTPSAARVTMTLPSGGPYTIVCRSTEAGLRGNYTVELRSQ